MRALELNARRIAHEESIATKFDLGKNVRLVPPFNESEVDKYFQHFERVAQNLKWPIDQWPLLLQSVLRGKAQEAYTALPISECVDYNSVKNAILKAYELVPEAYRQKFRNYRKQESQTHVEFAHEKEVYFDRWWNSREVGTDFEKLRQVILIEEFKRCVRDDIKTYLDEQKVENLAKAAAYADDYALTLSIDCRDVSLSKSKLISEQENDPELAPLFKLVLPPVELDKIPVGYYVRNGVLMRKWRPPTVPASEEWSVVHQIVVPKVYQSEILKLAHESPMGGHLGINKTYNKITKHFYWPQIRHCVAEFCKTCHICQMVGKPNQKIPVAPLKPIPAFEEPFSKVIIDCVGPLPKTKSRKQYLLTIMCASTRFPEAIPLTNITASKISKALVNFFTLVGLPKEIQSDQGSNFMSGLFQQVVFQLGAKQIKSSAYHPESQGALERFHSTLKNMIRTYCLDNEKDWDEGISLLLFAVRESVQESLGFSPFELVFGHSVRGPLKLLKENWLSENTESLNLSEIS